METPLIEFRDVTKRFGDRTVLDQVNLEIYENQITTIMGKSGAGKSVLLKHIIGLLLPDAGTILFRGKPVSKMRKGRWNRYRSKISYLFQNNALFDSMTVFDNVALPLRQTTTMSSKEIDEKAMARIEQTDLTEAAFRYPSELSGGMQKRVGLARAMAADPEIIFFDEPTTGLDPIMADVINNLIVDTVKDTGATTLSITHDLVSARKIADRIAMLYKGKIIWDGPTSEIDKSGNPYVEQFINARAEGPIQMEVRG